MRKQFLIIVLLNIFTACLPGNLSAEIIKRNPNLEDFLTTVGNNEIKMETCTADIEMQFRDKDNKVVNVKGEYFFKKPNKERVEVFSFQSNELIVGKRLIIDDGVLIWGIEYSPEGEISLVKKNIRALGEILGEILTENISGLNMSYKLRKSLDLLQLMQFYPKSIESRFLEGKEYFVLKMRLNEFRQREVMLYLHSQGIPQHKNIFPKDFLFYFNKENYIYERLEIRSMFDNSILFYSQLKDFKFDFPLDNDLFSYAPPANVTVIDAQQEKEGVKKILQKERKKVKREEKTEKIGGRLDKGTMNLLHKKCPRFSLRNLEGRLMQFEKLKGRILVITFWINYLDTSVQALPLMERLHQKYKKDKEVLVLSVTYGDKKRIKKLVEENNYTFPVLHDRYQEAFQNQFFIKTVPITVIVGKNGIIRYIYLGYSKDLDDICAEKIEEFKTIGVQKDYILLYARAIEYYETNEYEKAIDDLTTAININPEYFAAYYSRGIVYLKMRKLNASITDFRKSLEINPGDEDAYYNRAIAYFELGNYKNALADYEQALNVNDNNKRAYYGKGLVLFKLEEYKKAIACFDKVLKIDLGFILAYANRAFSYFEQGKYKVAVYDDGKVLNKQKDAVIYYYRGKAYEKLNMYKKALKDYDKALKLDDSYNIVYFEKAGCLEKMGEQGIAIKEYKEFLRKVKDNENNESINTAREKIKEYESI